MDNNSEDNKPTRHITRSYELIINFIRDCEECNLHKKVWRGGGLKLSDIGTKHVREDELNPRLGYAMVRLDNWKKTFQRGVTGYIRVWRTMCYEWLDWIDFKTWLNDFEMFIWVYNDELEFIITKRTLKTVLGNSVKETMYK